MKCDTEQPSKKPVYIFHAKGYHERRRNDVKYSHGKTDADMSSECERGKVAHLCR
jgi:hypothetical protein